MASFVIPGKEASNDQLGAWRQLALVLNARRRFRYTANLKKRKEAEARKKLKVSVKATQAALRFVEAGRVYDPEEDAARKEREAKAKEEEAKAKKLGFGTYPQKLALLSDAKIIKSCGGLKKIAQQLNVSLDTGITGDESDLSKRQEVYGSNTYPEKPPKGFFSFVWDAMQDLTLLILALCAVVSLGIGIPTEGLREGWYDGAGILFSIILVVIVTASSDYQQSLQFRVLEKEKKKIFIQVLRNGEKRKISIYDLVVGDIVQLSIGDQVPGDGLYISGHSLTINESSMTGESEAKHADEENPFILSGTKVEDGSGFMLITAVGMNTEWGQLMAVLGEGGEDETPLQVKLNGVATRIGQIGVAFAVVTFIVLMIRFLITKEDLRSWGAEDAIDIVNFFAIAVTIVVVAVPEGLPLAVTLTLAYAMKKMMADNALVRRLAACETMGSASCICSDKTGTLTTNQMEVVKVWIGGKLKDVNTAELDLHDTVKELIIESIFGNTSGDVRKEKGEHVFLGSPTETALLGFGVALGGDFKAASSNSKIIKCEPFNSSRKRMGVVIKHLDGNIRAHWKGAPEMILAMCDSFIDCHGHIIKIDSERRKELHGVIISLADQALRTLCVAVRNLEIEPSKHDPMHEETFTCLAIVGIKDPVRPGVRDAVKLCQSAGIVVRMVTGDNIHTAKAIARECGILTDGGESIEGPEFRALSPHEQARRIPKIQVMARAHPTDKYNLVKALQETKQVVAVTGDGTNDAPALHEADIGLAMGISGTEIAKSSADIILLDDKFQTIVTVTKWGRSVYVNVQKFVQFQLTVNIVALVINFTSACITGKAPLTAVQLLWVNLIMDTLGALALATEPPYEDLMKSPPVGRQDSFITNIMWRNITFQVVYQLTVLFILQYKGKEIFQLGDNDNVLNTLIFNSFVFCQVFNEINSREMERINVFRNLFSNWIFILVMTFTIIFQIILVELLGKLANTVPLDGWQWLISIVIGFISLPIAVIAKFVPIDPMSKFGSRLIAIFHRRSVQTDAYQIIPGGPNDVV